MKIAAYSGGVRRRRSDASSWATHKRVDLYLFKNQALMPRATGARNFLGIANAALLASYS